MKNINKETAIALRMRANYIETGDVNLSRVDVQERLAATPDNGAWLTASVRDFYMKALIKDSNLTTDQRRLVISLRAHADRVELD